MQLSNIREKIDAIDEQLVKLFVERMNVVGEVAASKKDTGKAIRDHARERAIIIRRYFHSHTQSAIAKDMGISQVQVSRLEGKILRRMRARAE